MSFRIEEPPYRFVADSAAPPPAAEGAPSAGSASPTRPADGAPNQVPPAVRGAGGTALPRAFALSGSVRTSQSSQPFAAADGASPSTTPSDAPASRPGWGSGREVPPTFDTHVDRALTVGGFPPPGRLGPRLVEPAPLADPALRDGWSDERTGLMSGGYPPVLAANDRDAGLIDDTRVWVPVRRHGIDRHALAPHSDAGGQPYTLCSRSTRTGHVLPAGDVWIVAHTQPCPRCWPGGAR